MSETVRNAARVLLLTVMVLSSAAVGQSFVESTSSPEPTTEAPNVSETPTPSERSSANVSTTSSNDSTDTETSSTATSTAVQTDRPDGTTEIDVESRFSRARNATTAGEDWSTQQVRRASGERGLTVAATQGFYVSDERAEITAFTPDGSIVYYNDSYRVYFDVDQVPDERYTVEYVAARHFPESECTQFESDRCTRNDVVRVNLTTGEQELVYSQMTPRIYSARWHDADRINDTHLVVADIVNDSVYAVDTRDDTIVWEWEAADNYTREQGGQSGDWTHVNDVELLPDGRVMVSLRNMDSVVFLNASNGSRVMDDSWTLGEEDDHDVLFEQHNPDYIPGAFGGPAVVVGDSENTRLVEYQRIDGTWERTWTWRDTRLQWPRDADRLPNGNTLFVDSHGDRVGEITPDNGLVWSADIGMPYDVERIGTGDESQGGPAARLRGYAPLEPEPQSTGSDDENGSDNDGTGESDVGRVYDPDGDLPAPGEATATSSRPLVDQIWIGVKDTVPPHVSNGLLYVSPSWVRFSDLSFAALFLLVGLVWGGVEFYWSGYTVRGLPSRGRDAVRRLREND